MPAIGGLKTPHPKELWDTIKALVIEGLAYKEIERQTGINEKVIRVKASNSGWTVAKAEKKAKEELAGEVVKASFARSLQTLSTKLDKSNPKSLSQACKIQSMLVPAVQNAKTVFGWGEQNNNNTLINVSVLAQCSTPEQASVRSVDTVSDPIDVLPVPDKSILFPGQDTTEQEG